MDINVDLLHWSINSLIKKTVKNDKNYQKNYANQLFENLIKKCTHIL